MQAELWGLLEELHARHHHFQSAGKTHVTVYLDSGTVAALLFTSVGGPSDVQDASVLQVVQLEAQDFNRYKHYCESAKSPSLLLPVQQKWRLTISSHLRI